MFSRHPREFWSWSDPSEMSWIKTRGLGLYPLWVPAAQEGDSALDEATLFSWDNLPVSVGPESWGLSLSNTQWLGEKSLVFEGDLGDTSSCLSTTVLFTFLLAIRISVLGFKVGNIVSIIIVHGRACESLWRSSQKAIVRYMEVNHKTEALRDFPGGPVVKTLCLQCRGCRSDPWPGN